MICLILFACRAAAGGKVDGTPKDWAGTIFIFG
jgi:hypothetical protein